MQKRKVKEIAKFYGVDLNVLTIKIQRNEKILSLPIAGSTDYKNMGLNILKNILMKWKKTYMFENSEWERLKKVKL